MCLRWEGRLKGQWTHHLVWSSILNEEILKPYKSLLKRLRAVLLISVSDGTNTLHNFKTEGAWRFLQNHVNCVIFRGKDKLKLKDGKWKVVTTQEVKEILVKVGGWKLWTKLGTQKWAVNLCLDKKQKCKKGNSLAGYLFHICLKTLRCGNYENWF